MTIAPEYSRKLPMIEIKKVVCPHDCPDACLMSTTIEAGKVTKITGDVDHPFTKGFLCIKTNYYKERLYSDLRVLYPKKRVGKKGAGHFERVSWDEALETIATNFKRIVRDYGAEAILPYSYAGTMGALNYGSMDRRFFNRLGASLLHRSICSVTGTEAYAYTMGATRGATDPETLPESKLIIAWGANPISTNVHLMPFINEAKKRGAKLITVDPHRSKTAEQSDWHIAPYPGTDSALALAMIHVIIRDNLHDREFIAQNTIGFEALAERVQEWTPARAEQICGVKAQQIEEFAHLYATTKPSCIRLNYGLNRHSNGGMMVRTVLCLPAIVGAWGVPGGGALLSTGGAFHLNERALQKPELLQQHDKKPRTVNMIKLGEALLDYNDPPVMGLYVYNSNPAVVAPNQQRVLAGLAREDLFTVVHEQVHTDTARYADILLPATTTFEQTDLFTSYGHLYIQLSEAAIEPLGESKPNVEVFSLLAQKMNFTEPCFSDTAEDLIQQALDVRHPNMEGITYERLKAETFVRLNVPKPFIPFADGKYHTPSGKIELYSARMLRAGLDPVPNHIPSAESADGSPELFALYPIRLVTPAAHHFLNSSFADMPTMRRKQLRPTLELNQADATERGIKACEWVRAWNDRGEAYFVADIKDSVVAGVACHVSLWWNRYSPKGWNCNSLTSDREADMAGGATFHTNLVQVERAAHKLNSAELAELDQLYQ